jgi:hypothetical protein
MILDSDFPAMEGASLALCDSVVLQARTKTQAQHAAVALAGSREHSSIKCVVDSTLCYTTYNVIPLQVQDPLIPPPASQPEVQHESCIPRLSPPAVGSQIQNQRSVPPVKDPKSRILTENPHIYPPVRQLVVNKAANIIHSVKDSPTRDCYGWDPMLDGEDQDSNSNQDLAILDKLHGEISDNTRRMMHQQFAHPTHASEGKDFMGLEDTINDVLRWLGDTVVFDPAAQEVEAPQPGHKDGALYDPILWPKTIEARRKARVAMELLPQPTLHQSSVDSCSEGAQEGTECVATMEVDDSHYRQPDALIPNHPAFTNFVQSQERTMNYRAAFNNVKQAKSFCREHFNGLDLQGVYHPRERHCATAIWGGRAKAKDAHAHIIKALQGLFRAQSQMHAQQGWEMLISQGRGVEASQAIGAHQGLDTQMGETKEGAENTRAVNGSWSLDVLLGLLDLSYDGTVSTEVFPRILTGASGNQQGIITGAMTDTMITQPSSIREAVNSGEKASGAVDPPAIATGSIGDC